MYYSIYDWLYPSGTKTGTTTICSLVICSTLVICAGAILIALVHRRKCQANLNSLQDVEKRDSNDMYGQYELDEADGQVVKLGLVCNAFVSIAKCIWFKLQNVFGPNCQMYLSKMQNVVVLNCKMARWSSLAQFGSKTIANNITKTDRHTYWT